MERAEFLAKIGLGFAAVCTGCALASCGSKSGNATPGGGVVVGGAPSPPKTGSGSVFSVDLNSQLTQIGDSTTQSGVILVRIAAGNTASAFTAVQVACTHQGTAINYDTGQHIFICPAHGSEFSQSGSVLVGPAALPLHVYSVTIDSNNKLTVSA